MNLKYFLHCTSISMLTNVTYRYATFYVSLLFSILSNLCFILSQGNCSVQKILFSHISVLLFFFNCKSGYV